MLIQEKFDKLSINCLSSAGDVVRLVLRGLSTLDEQHQLFSCADELGPDGRESATCVESLDLQDSAHSAELASGRSNMTQIEESVAVAQDQLADVQLALTIIQGEHGEHFRCVGIEEQRSGSLEALLRGLRSRLVDYTCLVDLV